MSQFVNYNKRSVKLPPGCKELSDLFKPKSLRKTHGSLLGAQQPLAPHEQTFFGTLASIEEHIAQVFRSRAQACAMIITPSGKQLTLHIYRVAGVMVAA